MRTTGAVIDRLARRSSEIRCTLEAQLKRGNIVFLWLHSLVYSNHRHVSVIATYHAAGRIQQQSWRIGILIIQDGRWILVCCIIKWIWFLYIISRHAPGLPYNIRTNVLYTARSVTNAFLASVNDI